MMKLGTASTIWSNKSFDDAIRDVLQNYSHLLSADDTQILKDFNTLVAKKENEILDGVSKIKSAQFVRVHSNRRGVKSLDPIDYACNAHKTIDESGDTQETFRLTRPSSEYNKRNILVFENGQHNDLRYKPLASLDRFHDGELWIAVSKDDFLPWVKLFEIGEVFNVSRFKAEHKQSLAAQRAAARALGKRANIDYANATVFKCRYEMDKNYRWLVRNYNDMSYSKLTDIAERDGKKIVLTLCTNGFKDAQRTVPIFSVPKNNEEGRELKVGDIQFIDAEMNVEVAADAFKLPNKDDYIFAFITVADYKRLKLWKDEDIILAADFSNNVLKSYIEGLPKHIKYSGNLDNSTTFDTGAAKEMLKTLELTGQAAGIKATATSIYKKMYADLSKVAESTLPDELCMYTNHTQSAYLIAMGIQNPISYEYINISFKDEEKYPLLKRFGFYFYERDKIFIDLRCEEVEESLLDMFKYVEMVDELEELKAAKASEVSTAA